MNRICKNKPRVIAAAAMSLLSLLFEVDRCHAQTEQPPTSQAATPDSPPFPDLTIPPGADLKTLQKLIDMAKGAQPQSPDQYKQMQVAIRDAARLQVQKLKGKPGSKELLQAEMDVITSSVALMTYFNEKQQAEVVDQLHQYLKSRKPLALQDLQTGMLAATMFELQPNKKPARDTYALMDELLKDDEREEMQNLRINLQANVRRLNLLGSKFELRAKSLDEKKINIEDYAGKFVIVDFFATWCEPCLSEIPRVRKHYEKYREKGLEVIGISLDGDGDALQAYLDRAKLPWPIIHDNAEKLSDRLQMKFGVSALPTVLLLNKEGTVVSLEARGSELDRLMQILFEAPTPAAAPPSTNTPTPASPATSAGNP